MAQTREALLTGLVLSRLRKMLGEVKSQQLVAEVFSRLGKDQVHTADELKIVAADLIGRGGLIKMIGHSLMTEALLRGARQY